MWMISTNCNPLYKPLLLPLLLSRFHTSNSSDFHFPHAINQTHNFPMLGAALTTPGPSLKLSPETTRFHRKHRPVTCAAVATSASLYEVLRVKHDASLTEIKTAYRSLAKLYHPDVSDGKEFVEIQEAYTRLSDPEMREEYDLSLRLKSTRPEVRVRPRVGFFTTRRWETDQCW